MRFSAFYIGLHHISQVVSGLLSGIASHLLLIQADDSIASRLRCTYSQEAHLVEPVDPCGLCSTEIVDLACCQPAIRLESSHMKSFDARFRMVLESADHMTSTKRPPSVMAVM